MHELIRRMCIDWDVSNRGARRALRFETSTSRDKSRQKDQAAIEKRIKEIAETRVRYGCQRVHVLPRREGHDEAPERARKHQREQGSTSVGPIRPLWPFRKSLRRNLSASARDWTAAKRIRNVLRWSTGLICVRGP